MKWHDLNTRYSDKIHELRSKPPHEILDVAPNASVDEIKAAYRRLVKVYHPDRADSFIKQTNSERLKVINSAYTQMIRERGPQQ